ncbi:MAG: SprT family zinc-dependent metalloprotease [Clostridia bacterium]|nr:SprT family zinc-dependent metalloprotease [Clostridia bacterium]
MYHIVLGSKTVEVKVINKSRTSKMVLTVKNGKVIVTKSCYTSMKSVEKLIYSHQSQILKYIDSTSSKIRFADGEKLLYLGKEYTLTIRLSDNKKCNLTVEDDKIVILVNKEQAKEEIYETMYKRLLKDTSEKIVEEKLHTFVALTNIEFNGYKVRYMISRWGSCVANKKTLNFNTKLAMLPDRVIDSVIVHELCHIVEPHHQDSFWKLVYQYIPDYKECNRWLKDNYQMIIL